jgi:5-bromo-4-chloroindolyl phosphate hydrolysis protein
VKVKPLDSIFSSVLGGLGFIIFFLFLDVSPVISIIIGIGIFIVALLGFSHFDPAEQKQREQQEKETKKLREVEHKLNRLENLKNKVVLEIASNINRAAQQSFKKIISRKDFYTLLIGFESHLDTAVNLLDKYHEIQKSGIKTDRMLDTKAKVEGMLEQVNVILANQFEKYYEQDMITIEAELSAVQEILDIETSFRNKEQGY